MTIEQIRLKETRVQKEMTQEQVAQALGVSQQAYQKLETGKTTDMRISTVKKICALFNISADWLLGLREQGNDPRCCAWISQAHPGAAETTLDQPRYAG